MYTYHARTNRVASTTDTGVDYRYNPSGNMTRSETAHDEGHVSLTYDYFLNRPARIIHPTWGLNQGTTDMAYNSSRQRVLKKTDEYGAINTTLYVHGLSAQPLSVTHCIDVTVRNECWLARYIWGPDGLIAELHSYMGNPSDERFVVKDHLGSIRLIVDADDGSVLAWQDYAPFGELMRGADIGAHLRYTYTGQEADTELGLMNYQARLYDPEIGIFLAADPAGQIAASYVYASNNPISFVDPDGEFFLPILMGAAIGAAISGASYSAIALATGDWSLGGLGTAMGMGAVGGGVSAAFSIAATQLGAVGHNASLSMLRSTTSYAATTIAFGGDFSLTGVMTSAAAGGLGGIIPGYTGTHSQGMVRSIAGELAHGATTGALIGGSSAALEALLRGQRVGPALARGAMQGGLSGGLAAGFNVAAFGYATQPDPERYPDYYAAMSDFEREASMVGLGQGQYAPVFRSGGVVGWFMSRANVPGAALGRNLLIHGGEEEMIAEEHFHYYQQIHMGFGRYAARGAIEQFGWRFGLYAHPYLTPGTMEYAAQMFLHSYGINTWVHGIWHRW